MNHKIVIQMIERSKERSTVVKRTFINPTRRQLFKNFGTIVTENLRKVFVQNKKEIGNV